LRIGPGPVFLWECQAAARRWQTYALRCVVIGIMLTALSIVWDVKGGDERMGIHDLAEVGSAFFTALPLVSA
jgi:hypothetical protein